MPCYSVPVVNAPFLLGADIIGLNCRFDPNMCLQTISLMKEALDKEGLKVHLMVQPTGYHAPDAGPKGFIDLPELPFGEFRSLVRHSFK